MTDYRREDDEDEELKASEGGGMSFLEHLEDFRWTVGRSVFCLLYTSPSPRDGLLSRMPSSA